MVKILEYNFNLDDELITLNMPENSQVLDVQLRDGRPVLFVMVITLMPMENRVFRLYNTGEDIQGLVVKKKYIGTVQCRDLTKHIFEL